MFLLLPVRGFTDGLHVHFVGWTKREGESFNTLKEQFILLLLLNVSVPATPCLKVKVLHLLISPPVL